MSAMKIDFRALSVAAALSLLAPLAAAAQTIEVKDLDTDEIVQSVGPGGTITLNRGDRVRLIMSVTHRNRTYYPQTEYWEGQPNGGSVRITRASVENANATVEAVTAGRSENIGYRILEDVRGRLEGSITIRVVDQAQQGSYPGGGSQGGGYSNDWVRELTRALYQGILMREMDEPGGRGYMDRIRRGGYSAVVQIAQEIARSEESRVRVYERANNQQRLLALYENLLGMESDDIDEEDWNNDLRRLNQGRISDVVSDMVRSEWFREYQEL